MSEPNDALAALITEADSRSRCSWAGLARRVNDLGAELGMALRYDYTAVNRWVKRGEKPRAPVPGLLAQALSEKLGRRVNAAEFGMSDEVSFASRALNYSSNPLTTVETVNDSPACMADLHVLESRALAAMHDSRAASEAVAKAEDTFQQVVPENEPEWARFIDLPYIFGEAAQSFRDMSLACSKTNAELHA